MLAACGKVGGSGAFVIALSSVPTSVRTYAEQHVGSSGFWGATHAPDLRIRRPALVGSSVRLNSFFFFFF